MKLKGWILLICVSLPLFSTAQNDFIGGTILLNSGDTLSMLIKKISGRIAPQFIQYKNTSSPEIKVLSAAQVKWVHYDHGDWYFGYVGPIEASSLNNNDLTYDTLMHTVIDSIFIRAVLISRASLFYARDRNDRIHLFYSRDKNNIIELVYKKYYVDEVVAADYQNKITKRAIMANELYKGQLIQAFADCPYVSTGILSKAITYSENDVLKLFEDYNQCKDAGIVYQGGRDKGRVEFSLQAGINSTGLKLTTQFIAWQGIHFDRRFGFQGGLGFNWVLPHLENKFSIYNEVLLKEHVLHGTSSTQLFSLKAYYAKLITMGRYQASEGNIKPFIQIGISNSVALSRNNSTSKNTTGVSLFDSYRTYEQGLVFGTGLRMKKIVGTLEVEKSNGFSQLNDLKTAFTTWYLQFGYLF